MGEKGIEASGTGAPGSIAGTSINPAGMSPGVAGVGMAALPTLPGVSASPGFGGPGIPIPAPISVAAASPMESMVSDIHRPPTG